MDTTSHILLGYITYNLMAAIKYIKILSFLGVRMDTGISKNCHHAF